jgi:hypothetical protein
MLSSKQLKILFIIDAFDEGSEENPLLDKIIERQLLGSCTVLLTSRPKHLKEKQNYFRPKYWVQGFNKEQQINFLCKHLDNKYIKGAKGRLEKVIESFQKWTQQKAEPWKQIKCEYQAQLKAQLEEEDEMCRNPLNLFILCTLINEDGIETRTSRVELYKDLYKFLLRKAALRMERSEDELRESVLKPLYQLAYKAYLKDRCFVTEEDLGGDLGKALCAAGFLWKEVRVSRFDSVARFAFSHKTFVEFLCAQEMQQMSEEDRAKFISGLQPIRDETLLRFIIAVLDEEALGRIAEFILDRVQGDDDVLGDDYALPLLRFILGVLEQKVLSYVSEVLLKRVRDEYRKYLRLLTELKDVDEEALGNIVYKVHPDEFKELYADCKSPLHLSIKHPCGFNQSEIAIARLCKRLIVH